MPDDIAFIFELSELVELFGYKNNRQALYAIRKGKFPVATFKIGTKTVAHVEVVKAYFEQKKQEGLKQLWD
jgi:hypothetical protein